MINGIHLSKAKRLCAEYHKDDPNWELVRQLICDLAGYKLKPLPTTGKLVTITEAAALGDKNDN